MAEKKVIELEVKENLGNLRQQLKQAQVEVQTLADKFGATSDQAREAAKRAAELKDRIGDAKALTDSFNPDAKFKGLGQALTGVAGGFAAVQGAMALVGNQSEEVEKTLLKVQSAMALAAGIDQLTEAKDAFVNLGKTAVKAFSAIKGAIGATGIGLLVVALGVIYTYWEDISKAVGFSTKESEKFANQQKAIGEEAKKQREEVAKQSGSFASLITQLKATNVNSEERVKLIKKINDGYGTTIQNLKDETKFQSSLNVELANYLEYQKAKYKLQKSEDLIIKNLEKQDELKAKILKNEKDIALQQKQNAEDIKKAKGTSIGGISGLSQTDKASLSASISMSRLNAELEKNKKDLKDAEARFENYGESILKVNKKIETLTDSGKKYVEQVLDKPDEKPKAIKAFEEKLHLDTIKLENLKITTGKETEIIGAAYAEQYTLAEQAAEKERLLLELKSNQAQKILAQANSFKVKMALEGLSIISDVTELFNKKGEKQARNAFKIQKAANIASATIQTYQSAAGAYASQFLPLPDPSSPVRGQIAAGMAVAGGLVRVAKIASQKFEGGGSSVGGGGGGGGGGATAPTMSAPQFNVVGQSGVNQLASLNQQPIQAYVVSGQVTSQQALDRNRLANATLGG
jgi:CRISPR/Cas system-associated endoribonuclease Cas2